MPAHYTHYYIARETLSEFSSELTHVAEPYLPLYFFGAQGADFCFFYRMVNMRRKNLGSYLHRKGGYTAFQVLKTLSAYSPDLYAYSLGFVTHYATDVTFHPYVYSASKTPIDHSRMENALDRYFTAQYGRGEKEISYFEQPLRNEDLDELFFAYAAIAAKCGFPSLQKPSFLRAISLFNAYLPLSSKLSGTTAKKAPNSFANDEKRAWAYPSSPALVRNDSANELFEKSVLLSQELCNEFHSAVKNNGQLDPALFGKNYLNGM